jgi:hypothetical protein
VRGVSAPTPSRPWRYLLAAFALGPLFALGLMLELAAFSWLRLEAPFMGHEGLRAAFSWQLMTWNALIAGATSALVSWWMRRRIVAWVERDRFVVALASALLGGPTFVFLYMLLGWWGSSLPVEPDDSVWEWLLSAALGGPLIGLVLGPIFLPVTLPLCWIGVGVLRSAGGRARAA